MVTTSTPNQSEVNDTSQEATWHCAKLAREAGLELAGLTVRAEVPETRKAVVCRTKQTNQAVEVNYGGRRLARFDTINQAWHSARPRFSGRGQVAFDSLTAEFVANFEPIQKAFNAAVISVQQLSNLVRQL